MGGWGWVDLVVMVKLHVYLFQTETTIRKIPSPANMLAHDPKSSTFHRHATGFCSIWADWVEGRVEKILNIYTRY